MQKNIEINDLSDKSALTLNVITLQRLNETE